MDKTSLAILDDHQLFRTGICELVNQAADFEMIHSVGTPEELEAAMAAQLPDMLILDIRLKNANGWDILRKIKSEHEDLKVIMLTMHDEASFVRRMIEQGADGYLTKDITPEELFHSLRMVRQLGKYYGPEIAGKLIKSLQQKESFKRTEEGFSDQEIEILILFSEGFTAEEIAAKLHRATRTIEWHRQKMLERTQSKNIASLIAWAFKQGVL